MAETVFDDAPEVADVAALILAGESEFALLKDEHIVYVFRDKAQKRNGQVVYGTCEVVRGKNALLYWSAKGKRTAPAFFRITISQDLWNLLDEPQRKWLVRHELRHAAKKMSKTGKKLTLRGHDFELFFDDLKDPCMEGVCEVWEVVKAGQKGLGF